MNVRKTLGIVGRVALQSLPYLGVALMASAGAHPAMAGVAGAGALPVSQPVRPRSRADCSSLAARWPSAGWRGLRRTLFAGMMIGSADSPALVPAPSARTVQPRLRRSRACSAAGPSFSDGCRNEQTPHKSDQLCDDEEAQQVIRRWAPSLVPRAPHLVRGSVRARRLQFKLLRTGRLRFISRAPSAVRLFPLDHRRLSIRDGLPV